MRPSDLKSLKGLIAGIREEICLLRQRQGEHSRATSNNHETQHEDQKAIVSAIALLRIPDEERIETERAKERRHRENLSQQRRLTRWTAAAFCAAAVYATLAFLQFNALNSTAKSAQEQARATLLYQDGRLEIAPDRRSYTVFIELKNTGNTPALSVRAWLTGKFTDTIPDEYSYFCPYVDGITDHYCHSTVHFTEADGRDGVTDIGAQGVVCITRPHLPINEQELLAVNRTLYIRGEAFYGDIFGDSRFDAFVTKTKLGEGTHLDGVLNWIDNPRYTDFPWKLDKSTGVPSGQVIRQGPCATDQNTP
jgi:hypothetical protein